MASSTYDLIIIGAGTAGITAVGEALALGAERVALIERETALGGECAHYACVPTKTLLTAVRLLKQIRHQAALYGVEVPPPQLNFETLASKVDSVVGTDDYDIKEDSRVTILHGIARFLSPERLEVDEHTITAPKIIIATGAEPKIPDIEGLETAGYWTFREASRIRQLPESLIIMGAGAVGVEFSQIFQNLGTQVTLIVRGDRILPREEPEISEALHHTLQADGVQIITQAHPIRVSRQPDGTLRMQLRRIPEKNGVSYPANPVQNEELILTASQLLVAIGTQPSVEALSLENAQVETEDKNGNIRVNVEMQTSHPGIWAIGDVAGPYRFTHVADYQAVIAVHNALHNAGRTVDYHAIPWAIYTEPSIAHVGLTEQEARSRQADIQVITAPAGSVSRNRIESNETGLVKLIIDPRSHTLLGGHIFATDAEEFAHLLLLAIQAKTPLETLRNLMFIYPSKAQLIQKALDTLSS